MGLTDVAMKVSNPTDPSLSRQLTLLVDSGAMYPLFREKFSPKLELFPTVWNRSR